MRSLLRWLSYKSLTDEQLVENTRRSVRTMLRFRKWQLAFHSTLLVMVFVLAFAAQQFLQQFFGQVNPQNVAMVGFAIGVSLGFSLGLLLFHSLHGLLTAATYPPRLATLMLRYHDALAQLTSDPTGTPAHPRTSAVEQFTTPPR